MLLFIGLKGFDLFWCGVFIMVGAELFVGQHGVEMFFYKLVTFLLSKL
jgi:hypothetical protein